MKKGIYLVAAVATALTFASCGGSEETTDVPVEEELCFYTYDSTSTEFGWVAYKTNDKVEVGGSFNDIQISGETSSDDPMKLIESLSFVMKTGSVETNNEERNGKIANLFFGTINTAEITGNVKSLKDGKAVIAVKMNGISVDVPGDYTFEDGKFTFTSTVDVKIWNAMSGIARLNEECKELHTGEDGVSKLWSEVALSFSTQLISDCD